MYILNVNLWPLYACVYLCTYMPACTRTYMYTYKQGYRGKIYRRTLRQGWWILPWVVCVSGHLESTHQELGNRDALAALTWPPPTCRHLVNAGVLTVRDAGSWWLAVPGAGRFIKCFVKGVLPKDKSSVPQEHLGVFRSPCRTHLLSLGHLSSRAPGCTQHGAEGQIPGTSPVGAAGPQAPFSSAARPCLPCA